jgi:quercetin dioxygenase-like cupin family protein
MFYKRRDDGYRQLMPGVAVKTLVHGERTLFTEFRLAGGHTLPMHAHPHEQTGYLVSGAIVLTIGGERFEVRPGDSWNIPGDVEHGAQAVADSVAIEVFSPVREDYLPG